MEQEHNIKLLHQLKRAHATIEDMKRVLEKADKKIAQYKADIKLLQKERALDQDRF